MSSADIDGKLWNYCNVLSDDGMSYGEYPSAESILSAVEGLRTGSDLLTYLLFLKLADERTKGPYDQPSMVAGSSAREATVTLRFE